MRSFQVCTCGQPLQCNEYPTPKPAGTEVLLKVLAAGVCHSDLHLSDGYFDLGGGKRMSLEDRGMKLPVTLGHENVGEVVAVGPQAQGVKVGDRRLAHPWIGCGTCAVCLRGDENLCRAMKSLGVFSNGGYSDYLLLPHPRYLIDIGDLPVDRAAPLACSGVTAYSASAKLPTLAPSDRVAVIGCGGVGMAGIAVLRAKGVKNIVACDIDDAKLEIARKLGAKLAVNTRSADAAQQLQGIAGAIDFVGNPATAALGIAALRKGGRYVLVGLHGGELVHPLPPIAQRAIGIVGSYVGSLQELKEVVALAKKGKLKPMPVETRPAEEVNGALQDLNAGRVVGRVVLDFERLAA